MQIQPSSQSITLSPFSGVQVWKKSFGYMALVLDWRVLFGNQTLGWIKICLFTDL